MTQMGGRPVPARRRDLQSQQYTMVKMELVNSFVGFNAATVSETHMKLARKCIREIPSRHARFEYVPFHMIIQWNQDKPNYPSTIAQACDLLLKYVINLLKPKRPQVWRSIKTTNSHFCARVDCMVGARDILVQIGYSETSPSAMQFPESVKEPNKEKLHIIAAELLMAKLEAENLPYTPTSRQPSLSSTGSQLTSTPGTPNSSQLLQQQISQGPPQNGHVVPTTSYMYPSHVTLPGNTGPTVTDLLYQPHTPVQPTELFTPKSYEVPSQTAPSIPQNIPRAPPVSKTPSANENSSLGSSGDSDYATPPTSSPPKEDITSSPPKEDITSSPPKDDIMPSTPSSPPKEGMIAAYQSDLAKIRQEREKIKVQLGKKVHSDVVQLRDHDFQRSVATSVIAKVQDAPTKAELMKRPPKKAQHHPDTIIEEVPTSDERTSEIVAGPSHASNIGLLTSGPPHASNFGPSTSGPLPLSPARPETFCTQCGNRVTSVETRCSYCRSPVSFPAPTSSMLPPPIVSTETGLMRMGSDEPKSKPLRASAASTEEAIQHHRRTQAFPAAMQDPPGGNLGAVGGASGGGETGALMGTSGAGGQGGAGVSASLGVLGGAPSYEKSYKEIMADKLEFWKAEWRKRGYSDDEIPAEPGSVPLPPPKEKKPPQPPPPSQPKRRPKRHYDPSKSTTYELERYRIEEQRKEQMARLAEEGQSFMECIKECVHHSYALEEVELAYRKCHGKEVLKYLRNDWAGLIRDVQQYVAGLVDGQGRSVGVPSDLEARKYLALNDGNVLTASHKIYAFRKKKIEELQRRFKPYVELERKVAEMALSIFDMDVERAACSIDCETLDPLYEFIFSEWTQVAATDMKKIKERLKKEKDGEGREASLRMLMGEFKLENKEKASMVIELMDLIEDGDLDYPLSYYIDAAKDFSTMEDAERGLIKECPICTLSYPVHEMIIMPGCTDTMCKECFRGHFRVTITEKGVKHFNCPTCDQPDMTNRDDAQDLYQELFVHLIHEYLPEQYNLVQQKLAERNLQKDPGFCWCVNEKCASCFINPNLERKKIQCPTCNELMCFQCKKPWEDQHTGLSCEEFAEWKRLNDPKFQKEGLAAHLQANGIECPDCHMRYELARGGCMHFKCTRCPNEFCSGCGGSFKKAQACGRFQSCATRGLHAHHPRDCLYFMRDFSVEQLQGFLRENNVEFETKPSQEQLDAVGEEKEGEEGGEEAAGEANAEGEAKKVVLKCSAMLQKETVDKLIDEACGEGVKEGHAGLCEKHYKEYLVDRINKSKLDPLPLYDNIGVILTREEKKVPEREGEETDEDYRERLIQYVKQELPLQRGQQNVAKEQPPPGDPQQQDPQQAPVVVEDQG